MIPKIIHYCWFGGKALPSLSKICIESWKKYCPDYEIIEWNESNYDVAKNRYMYQAYQFKKWGFVSDYARKDIVYNYGGIYLDTDVEIIKSFDNLLCNEAFFGLENSDTVMTGLGFGAEKGNRIVKELRAVYDNVLFVNDNGSLNLKTCDKFETPIFVKYGLKFKNETQLVGESKIYSTEYFAPRTGYKGEINITDNTYSIHHYCLSWASPYVKFRGRIYQLIKRMVGVENANIVRSVFGKKE